MIVMNTLRYSDKIRARDDFELPRSNGRKLALHEKEIEMTVALLKGMAGGFEPANCRASYHEDVPAPVQRKLKANQARLITPPEAKQEQPARGDNRVDLMALLRQSVHSREQAGCQKGGRS